MAQSGDFLARVKLMLEGKEAVVSGLKETQQAAQKLSKTKVITTFDKEGLATGKQIEETFTTIQKTPSIIGQMADAMKRALIVAPVWMLIRSAIQGVTNTIQTQIKFLIDLETAMTRIKIVGKGTEEEYKNLQNALVGLAYTYGTTASEAADAAVLFAQQGKTVKETIELTRAAMLSSKILGTDLKTSVDDMTAAIEGFKLSASDATSIVDKWINVEKQFAVTSKDLADATKVAGATANQLGITISEFLGDVTAVIEVTRKSGNEAARGLSFMYARLYTSAQQTIEQIAKIPFYLDATGKATNAVGTQLRSEASILEDLASKWNTLTTAEKLQIAESLGSKRQMVVINALMQNYQTSLDARIASLTSAGSAEKAFALIQDTTATKLKQVAAAWNVLTTALGDTSGFKTSLSLFDKMLINLTALISYEKAYGALYTKEINKVQLSNETRLSEIKSLEELISVRNRLAKVSQTPENIERLKIVQDAIDAISKKQPRIQVALETGRPEELKKSIADITKELDMEKIRLNVSLEFEKPIAAIEEEIRNLQRQLTFTGGSNAVKLREQISNKEKEITKLTESRTKSLDEQYKIQKAQETTQKIKIDGIDDEESSSSALTEKEKERLSIEQELIKIRFTSSDALELQVQKEIELVKQSTTLYDIHEKNLKLEELSNKLLDARLQKRKQEENTLMNLSMKYEEADMFEKSRIRRVAELTMKTPEEVATAYQGGAYDKRLIGENLSQFTKEQQDAIAKTTMLFKELSGSLTTAAGPKVPQNITTYGAQNINVNVDAGGMATADEILTLINKMINEKLMTDESFINLFAKKISPKI